MVDKAFWQYLRSVLRRAFLRFPTRVECITSNRIPYVGDNKRRKWSAICEICKEEFKLSEVQVDHIIGAGSLKCSADVAGFIERLFCRVENLQVLCKPCHKIKTAEDRQRIKGR